MKGKLIIISAPSGSGKSTIIKNLIKNPCLNLGFSISATSRSPRPNEKNGIDYYFLTEEEFKQKVENNEFAEWEEVYEGVCYGTLESEIKRITDSGKNLIMDIDVKGALNLKKKYGDKAISLFIMPPDLEQLEKRLRARGTEEENTIRKRLKKAEYELGFADQFDAIVINDILDKAVSLVENKITKHIS